MNTKERIFHSLLFEVTALITITTLALLFTDKDILSISGLGLFMSLLAMVWNYFYNIIFDRFFGADRASRTFKTRVIHSIGFEVGLLAGTIPAIMWVLNLGFITALMLDLGAVAFFLVFTIVFNYAYDAIRPKFVGKNNQAELSVN